MQRLDPLSMRHIAGLPLTRIAAHLNRRDQARFAATHVAAREAVRNARRPEVLMRIRDRAAKAARLIRDIGATTRLAVWAARRRLADQPIPASIMPTVGERMIVHIDRGPGTIGALVFTYRNKPHILVFAMHGFPGYVHLRINMNTNKATFEHESSPHLKFAKNAIERALRHEGISVTNPARVTRSRRGRRR